MSSDASIPRRARGWADSSDGINLLIVALAFFARASRRKAAGGLPMEGSVLPMAFCAEKERVGLGMILCS